jgi:hypothetical protein
MFVVEEEELKEYKMDQHHLSVIVGLELETTQERDLWAKHFQLEKF